MAFATLLLSGTDALAQPSGASPRPSEEAVARVEATAAYIIDRQPNWGDYYSHRLKAYFIYDKVTIPRYVFYAARITAIDPDSPLHQFGLQPGDVVIRLDGRKVTRGRWWDHSQCAWQFPQMERHYGRTRVRYLIHGTHRWRDGYTNLGPRWPVFDSWSPSGGP